MQLKKQIRYRKKLFIRSFKILLAKLKNKKIVHLIHISKTGGTAIKEALKDNLYNDDIHIVLHSHDFNLKQVKNGEFCFFFLRNPLDRFVSSFNSRKRKGMPRFHNEWSKNESIAFSKYSSPNELAENLTLENIDAIKAVNSISHLKNKFTNWIISLDYLKNNKEKILFIGFQENLNDDFTKLKNILKIPIDVQLPQDDVKSHRSQTTDKKNLSSEAISNLKAWYSDDIEIYEQIKSNPYQFYNNNSLKSDQEY